MKKSFTLYTDRKPLMYGYKHQMDSILKLVYKPGNLNIVADVPSRLKTDILSTKQKIFSQRTIKPHLTITFINMSSD